MRRVRLLAQLAGPFLEKIVKPRPFVSAVFAGPFVGPEIPAVDAPDKVSVVTPPTPHHLAVPIRVIYGLVPFRAGVTFTIRLDNNDPEIQIRSRFDETGDGVRAGH